MAVKISSLTVYPMKSCRGIDLKEAVITKRGILHDRSSLLVNSDGLALTQRDFPRLALVETKIIDENVLQLSAPEFDTLILRFISDGKQSRCRVWGDECLSIDQGDEVAAWFGRLISTDCRLVRMPEDFVRHVDSDYATGEQQVGFADGYPFLLISEASLSDLNSKLEVPVPMNRFRPNIVVSGCEAFAEDSWKSISISGVHFDIVKPCARCVMVTIDQDHAIVGKEPLRTLSAYRQVEKKVMFGQNLVHHSTGVIRLGDTVEILS